MSTINHMRDPNQMLLIPITLWLGFSLAFIGADYTKSFVACSKGVDKVGFAMICFGLTDALGSYLALSYTSSMGCGRCRLANAGEFSIRCSLQGQSQCSVF